MRITVITVISLVLAAIAFAQPAPSPTAQDLENQLTEVGCKAERQTAAQTILQLRQQIADLQKQLAAKAHK